MEFNNSSRLNAAYGAAIFKNGQQGVLLLAKGTWSIPLKGQKSKRLTGKNALEIQETDTFLGEPGESSPLYENDFPTHKPKCDVIVHGCAYSLSEQPEKSVIVGLKLNNIDKKFRVTGKRVWEKTMLGIQISKPQPVTKQTISYDIAFGGTDTTLEDKGKIKLSLENPIGIGYMPYHDNKDINGKLAPQTEEIKDKILSVNTLYKPQSFGPIGKSWLPRMNYGGTYDENWIRTRSPLLPDDFDERYYQCAPVDQQTDYLVGGEKCQLIGMSSHGDLTFSIPEEKVYMAVIDHAGEEHILSAVADTLIIEPEHMRFSIVWRATFPIHRSFTEIKTVLIGEPTKAWRRAKMFGKTYMKDKGRKSW